MWEDLGSWPTAAMATIGPGQATISSYFFKISNVVNESDDPPQINEENDVTIVKDSASAGGSLSSFSTTDNQNAGPSSVGTGFLKNKSIPGASLRVKKHSPSKSPASEAICVIEPASVENYEQVSESDDDIIEETPEKSRAKILSNTGYISHSNASRLSSKLASKASSKLRSFTQNSNESSHPPNTCSSQTKFSNGCTENICKDLENVESNKPCKRLANRSAGLSPNPKKFETGTRNNTKKLENVRGKNIFPSLSANLNSISQSEDAHYLSNAEAPKASTVASSIHIVPRYSNAANNSTRNVPSESMKTNLNGTFESTMKKENNKNVLNTPETTLLPNDLPKCSVPIAKNSSKEIADIEDKLKFDSMEAKCDGELQKFKALDTKATNLLENAIEDFMDDSDIDYDKLAADMEEMSPFKVNKALPDDHCLSKFAEELKHEGIDEDSYCSTGDFGRHIVLAVTQDSYKAVLCLSLLQLSTKTQKTCYLHGTWSESVVKEDDIVHILFCSEVNGEYSITDDESTTLTCTTAIHCTTAPHCTPTLYHTALQQHTVPLHLTVSQHTKPLYIPHCATVPQHHTIPAPLNHTLPLYSIPAPLHHWTTGPHCTPASLDHIVPLYSIPAPLQGVLIINPDELLSGTSVVAGCFCRRKAALAETFRGVDGSNQVMLVGSLVHQLFQDVVEKKEGVTSQELQDLLQGLLQQTWVVRDMYGLGITAPMLLAEMNKFLPHIEQFLLSYMPSTTRLPLRKALKKVSGLKRGWKGTIEKILDCEENFWSPRFGLKGKVDLTLAVRDDKGERVVPLELKTGKATFSSEHRGQLMLYSLMMGDRRPPPRRESSLLLYLSVQNKCSELSTEETCCHRTGDMEEVSTGHLERRELLQLRNEMSSYFSRPPALQEDGTVAPPALPPPLDRERACQACPHLLACCALNTQPPPAPHAMASLLPATLAHLQPNAVQFFRHWCLLLHLEASQSKRTSSRALWCQGPLKREASGNAVVYLQLVSTEQRGVMQWLHTFTRAIASMPSSVPPSLPSDTFHAGDMVVVSTSRSIAVAQGILHSSDTHALSVMLDRNLLSTWEHAKSRWYHVDACQYHVAQGQLFTGLLRLMQDTPPALKLRQLIIDRVPGLSKAGLSRSVVQRSKVVLRELNEPQQRALVRCLLCPDYTLIRGYPGTGQLPYLLH
ncbi:DNA replication factor Dna2 N-terminal [Trinorchestia longiramus]|nr:DNA replication factor Dna2 N-terminal [Trinorchestia longiramus]